MQRRHIMAGREVLVLRCSSSGRLVDGWTMLHLWIKVLEQNMWWFPEIWVPPNHPYFSSMFPHTPSIFGYPHLWKPLETPMWISLCQANLPECKTGWRNTVLGVAHPLNVGRSIKSVATSICVMFILWRFP